MATEKQPKQSKQPKQLAAIMVMHQEQFGDLAGSDREHAIRNPHMFMRLALQAWIRRGQEASPVWPVASFDAGYVESFDAMKAFSQLICPTASMLPDLDKEFQRRYLKKVEKKIPPCKLISYQYLKSGFPVARTALAHMCMLLSLPWERGRANMMLPNGYPNAFLIPDADGVDGIVEASWFSGRWYINANSAEKSSRFQAGGRVISL